MNSTMRFTKTTISDPAVGGLEGADLFIPDGWTLEGGFFWMPLFTMQANLLLRVVDPATGAALSTLGIQQFCWPMQPMSGGLQPGTNWLGSVMLPPPRSPAECVHALFLSGPLKHLAGAGLVRTDDLAPYAAELNRSIPNMTVRVTRLRYAYNWGGRPWEEDVYLTVTFDQQNAVVALWWCYAFAMRAPAGTLDALTPVLAVPALSTRFSLDWSAVLDHTRNEFRQSIRRQQADTDPARRGRIWADAPAPIESWLQGQNQIREAHRRAWSVQQAQQDRHNLAAAGALGGLETYVDPFASRPVQLPPGYREHWISSDGRIVATNEPAFDPRQGGTAEWRRMDRYQATSPQQATTAAPRQVVAPPSNTPGAPPGAF